jgi:hypothetical protein
MEERKDRKTLLLKAGTKKIEKTNLKILALNGKKKKKLKVEKCLAIERDVFLSKL